MQSVKRLEIVIESLAVESLLRALTTADAKGYTIVRAVEGMGERGLRRGDELTGTMQNSLVIVACAPHKVATIVEAVRPLLKRFGGMCLVSDAERLIV